MKWRLSFTFSLLLPLSFSVLSSSVLSDEGAKWNASLICAVASLLKLSSAVLYRAGKIAQRIGEALYLIHDLSDIERPVYGKGKVN